MTINKANTSTTNNLPRKEQAARLEERRHEADSRASWMFDFQLALLQATEACGLPDKIPDCERSPEEQAYLEWWEELQQKMQAECWKEEDEMELAELNYQLYLDEEWDNF